MSPVGLSCLLFSSILVWNWVPADCFANGKVAGVCGSMEPHHGVPGQTTPAPYHLETNTTAFSPTDHIQVVLSGTKHFEGFMLEARDATNENSQFAVGTFTLTDPARTQLLTCNKLQGSAVSHTSDARQNKVVVIWKAPTDAPKQVQFFASVVSHYKVFWVKLPGPIISEHGVPPQPTHPVTTSPVPTTTPSILPGPFTSEGCGQSKSCLQYPQGCDPEEDPHCFFLSMATEGSDKMSVKFELSGPAEGYVAFALSRDTWMGNDDVYMCVKDGDTVTVSAASVSGRTPPDYQTQSGLSSLSWRLADGAIQCSFSRPVKLNNQDAARYDLDGEYFLFVAHGRAVYGQIGKHRDQPLISTHKKNIIGPPEVLSGSRSPTIMKIHGALMLLAWMVTASVGTFIASFYKPHWPDQTLCGQKVWFQVHRVLMTATVVLTVIAFCLPFFYRQGWSQGAGVHAYLGCCVLALSVIQPIMAGFRPSPDSHRRYIFNWAHFAVGSAAEIMAVAAMFLGTKQSSLLLPQPLATRVLIGYVIWLASFRILLPAHKIIYNNKSSASEDTQAIFPDQSKKNPGRSLLKSLILAVMALGNVGLLMAMWSFIIQI